MAVFNIIPNFPIQETWEWETDVLNTIDGTESRLSIRNRPRITVAAVANPLSAAERRTVGLTLAQNILTVVATPLWPYAGPIQQTTTSGNARVYFENSRVPVDTGGIVILINPGTGQVYAHTVLTVETDGATLDTNVAVDITPDGWLAVLGFNGKIRDNSGFGRQADTSQFKIEIEAYELPSVQRPGTAATLDTLDGLNILDRSFLQGAREEYEYPRETIDFTSGLPLDFSQWPHARVSGPRVFLSQRLFDPTDLDYWRLFLDTVKGGWKPFLLSTQSKDMTLQTALVANGTSMSINEDIDADFLAYDTWGHFEILYSDGTKSRHTISSATGAGPVTVNFTPNLPNDAKVANVTRISHLLKCRMADNLTLTHNPTTTTISFDITTTDYG